MSPISQNLRILELLTEAFNEHDLDKIMGYFADDCSLDMPRGPEPWGARYFGKASVRDALRRSIVPWVAAVPALPWLVDAQEADFQEVVVESPLPVLVDCWAAWCGPCRTLGPILEDVVDATDGKVELFRTKLKVSFKYEGHPDK